MKSIVRDLKGFTLIEIITVVIVLAILGSFTFSFIDHAMKIYLTGSRQRVLYQEASYIMERLTREMRDARTVSIDSTTGGLLITKAAHPSNSIVTDSSTSVLFYRNSSREMIRSSTSVANMSIGKNVEVFSPSPSSCSSRVSKCTLTISLPLTDSGIPINDAGARSVVLATTISPKNIQTGTYDSRCFNGDYEDVIR